MQPMKTMLPCTEQVVMRSRRFAATENHYSELSIEAAAH
jgi:hypothetical protein